MTKAFAFFAEDFGAPAAAALPAAEPVEPVFTASDLAAARRSGWEDGFDAGRAARQDEHMASSAGLLAKVAEEISVARQDLQQRCDTNAQALAELLLAAMRKAMPELCARHGAEEIARVARDILPPLLGQSRIRIQIAPSREAALRQVIAGMDEDLIAAIEITPNDRLGPADLAIRWQFGEAVRDAARIWSRIEDALAPHGLAPSTDAAASAPKEPTLAE